MTPPNSAQRSLELSPTATAALLLVFGASGGLGYLWAGLGGAFFAALGVTTCAVIVGYGRKMRAHDRTRLTESAPNLSGLPPAKALSMMGAMAGNGSASSFKSELLTRLEELDETLEGDPSAALQALEALVEGHPRSPAVHQRRARALVARGERDAASQAASTAIRYALDGGMNPMASAIFVEFESLRDDIDLEDRHLRILARALALRDHDDEARWCEAQR